jgi:hypothetical protein
MSFYVLYNYYDCYNIYSNEKNARYAFDILKKRYELSEEEVDTNITKGHKLKNKKLYIFEVKEGETFGEEIKVNHEKYQDCKIPYNNNDSIIFDS